MKPIEFVFLKRLYAKEKQYPRNIIEGMLEERIINSPKQCWRILEKWEKKGYYGSGVSIDLGWFTPKGLDWASKCLDKE